jgi:hypothetical protein
MSETLGQTSREKYETYLEKTAVRQAQPLPPGAIVRGELTLYDFDRVGYATLPTKSSPPRVASDGTETRYYFSEKLWDQ